MTTNVRSELYDKKAEWLNRYDAINALAKSEGRALSEDEQVQAKAALDQAESIDRNIQLEERAARLLVTQGASAAPSIQVGTDREASKPWGFETFKCSLDEFVARTPAYVSTDNPSHPRNLYMAVAFGEMLRAVHANALNPYDLDKRLITQAATGMSETVPSDGGFAVQTEFRETILEKVYNIGEITRRLNVDPVGANANGIAVPYIDETSRINGSRWGGLQAYWTGEAGTISSSKPKLGKFRIDLDKIAALVYVTDEQLQDSASLGSMLSRLVPQEISFKLEDGVINGTGSGMPTGIVNATCLVSVAKETGQKARTIVAENIIKMYSRLWARSQQNAVWLINQDVLPQLFTLSINVGTGGAPIFMPAGGLSNSPYNTLLGRPILPVEYCQTLGTQGDIMLADFGEYATIDKGGVQQASSIHVAFTTGEQAFRFTYRVNGAPWWSSALTPKNGTNTVSPFVALDTRA